MRLFGEEVTVYDTEEEVVEAIGSHLDWIRKKDREIAEWVSSPSNEYQPMSYYFEFFLRLRDLLDDVAHNPQTMQYGYYTDRRGIQYGNITQEVIDVFAKYSNTETHRFLTTVFHNLSGEYVQSKETLAQTVLKNRRLMRDMYADLYMLQIRLEIEDERIRRVKEPFTVSGFAEMILGDRLFPDDSVANYREFLEVISYSITKFEKLGGR